VPEQADGLEESWRQNEAIATSFQTSSPAVGDEHVFVGGLGETFYALAREDGRVVWTHNRDGSMSDSSPTVQDGTVYVGSGGGSLYAFDAVDGSIEWRQGGSSAITSSPIVRDGVVYVGRNDGVLWALDADDGSIRFEYEVGSPINTDIAYSSAREAIYVSTADLGVSAHDVTDGGRMLWAQRFGSDVGSSTPVVDDRKGVLYFASNEVRALDTGDGAIVWGTSFYGTNAGSSPIFDDDSVYVGSASGKVYRIPHPETTLATASDWTFQTWDISIAADPVIVGDALVVGTLSGTLFLLEIESGSQLDQCSLSCDLRAKPAVDGTDIYISGDGGGVYAFEL